MKVLAKIGMRYRKMKYPQRDQYNIGKPYHLCWTYMIYQWPSQQDNLDPLYAKVKLKYNFVETPSKFIIAKLSIRELGFSA